MSSVFGGRPVNPDDRVQNATDVAHVLDLDAVEQCSKLALIGSRPPTVTLPAVAMLAIVGRVRELEAKLLSVSVNLAGNCIDEEETRWLRGLAEEMVALHRRGVLVP
jgi:hypothetical protein